MTLKDVQKKIVIISSMVVGLVAMSGSVYSVFVWVDSNIVTRSYLDEKRKEDRKHLDEITKDIRKTQDITFNELNLRLIDESLSRYYDKDISKLKGKDLRRYQKLLLAETANEARRKVLLGL